MAACRCWPDSGSHRHAAPAPIRARCAPCVTHWKTPWAARIAWLRARPLSWRSGNVWALHAGADPHQPLDSQGDEVLLWGHPAFRRSPRRDGQWVVHGHTIVEHPHTAEGRIAVDTGAYATGRLSAALIECGAVRFLQTGSDR